MPSLSGTQGVPRQFQEPVGTIVARWFRRGAGFPWDKKGLKSETHPEAGSFDGCVEGAAGEARPVNLVRA